MGGPIPVALSNIFYIKREFDVVKALKPNFNKRYINDIYSKWVNNQPDKFFEKLNKYLSNKK